MKLTLSPVRQYRKRIILTAGLTVEMIRSIVVFLEEYKKEMDFSELLEKDLAKWKQDVAKLEKEVGKDKKDKKAIETELQKAKAHLTEEFFESIKNVDELFSYLETITIDDATLIFREMGDIFAFLGILERLKISPAVKLQTSVRLQAVLSHMASALHHFWEASKAQARGYVKLEERSLMSDYAEKRRLKEEAIEARQLTDELIPKKKEIVKLINSNASHEKIHAKIEEIVELYEKEFHDLQEIMHQAKILLHRTEQLLNRLQHEAKSFKQKKISRKVMALDQHVQRMLLHIQKQTLREYLDVSHEAQALAADIDKKSASLKRAG
ncbi:MAG: hypothetical protein KJ574_04980 [Nanoarchaeota archaeon]|nr:hypothetical protein [Nanoarchaeota archaeon]